MLRTSSFLLLCACRPETPADTAGPQTVGWTAGLPRLAEELPEVRGQQTLRTVIHLHSPYSHDACDGAGYVDGVFDETCLDDLRLALCSTAYDVAFVTDHPAHAAEQQFSDLLLVRGDDTPVDSLGQSVVLEEAIGNRVACDEGGTTLFLPGIEDELMPVGLDRQAGADADENSEIYNGYDLASLEADMAAGATGLVAHTEGRELADLQALVAAGLTGFEIFNLHAMFDPDIREDDLGLDGLGWATEIAPFTSPDGTGEPDLLLLALLQDQEPSLTAWDIINNDPPDDGTRLVVGTAGADAHQNSLPIILRDGERGDSYRRMLRWFSNHLRVSTSDEQASPSGAEGALRAGNSYVAFEVLGTPMGVDLWLEDDHGGTTEMGGVAAGGTLHVGCPTLSPSSPRGLAEPEIVVTVLRDGETWAEGCGDYEVSGPATYRVRVDLLPWHLADYLGDDASPWMREYPWVYTNPIRVTDP
jgi:hypothetical protein